MKVLVACEFSGRVRDAFVRRGHDAWSCDLLETELPGNHIVGNVLDIIADNWDMIVVFPPCTYLSNAGAVRMFPKRNLAKERYAKMLEGKAFFLAILNAPCDQIAVENPLPLSIAGLPPYTQIIQPYLFGDPVRKRTCLWLKELPPLLPTKIVRPEMNWISAGSKGRPKHAVIAKHRDPKTRSLTFYGIADAMAEQWG